MKVVIEQGEYQGSPTISIRRDTVEQRGYPFSFGGIQWNREGIRSASGSPKQNCSYRR